MQKEALDYITVGARHLLRRLAAGGWGEMPGWGRVERGLDNEARLSAKPVYC